MALGVSEWYVPSNNETLFGVRCVKHGVTKELCIFGKYGEIYEKGPGIAGVILRAALGQTKLAKINDLKLPALTPLLKGDERNLTVSTAGAGLMAEICKAIGVPKSISHQALLGNGQPIPKRAANPEHTARLLKLNAERRAAVIK